MRTLPAMNLLLSYYAASLLLKPEDLKYVEHVPCSGEGQSQCRSQARSQQGFPQDYCGKQITVGA